MKYTQVVITSHCLDRYQQRFHRGARQFHVERAFKNTQPIWKKLKHRINEWRRIKGHKAFDWKEDCEYFVNQHQRSIWVARIKNDVAFVMTCMDLEI